MTPLVLASTSRYRRELLARLGLPFDVDRPDVDESPLAGESPASTAVRRHAPPRPRIPRPPPNAGAGSPTYGFAVVAGMLIVIVGAAVVLRRRGTM